MGIDGATFGFMGALGGSAVTGAAAYLGPLRLERIRAVEQRVAERRQRLAESRAAYEGNAVEAHKLVREFLVASGLYVSALARWVQLVERGAKVEIKEFDDEIVPLHERALSALWDLDEFGADSLVLVHADSAVKLIRDCFLGTEAEISQVKEAIGLFNNDRRDLAKEMLSAMGFNYWLGFWS